MSSNPTKTDKKRKSITISHGGNTHGNNSSYHRYKVPTQQNPKRGGPGILLTCETGREYRARREALQILQQDWEILTSTRSDTNGTKIPSTDPSVAPSDAAVAAAAAETSNFRIDTNITLDEELAQLQKDRTKRTSTASSPDSPFAIYETGCKGTVLILYQQPLSLDVASPMSPSTSTKETDIAENDKTNGDNEEVYIHTQQRETNTGDATSTSVADERSRVVRHGEYAIGWDPLLVVQRIVHDMALKSPTFTSSRYISRLIPIQKTCYATIEDISIAVQSLLEPIVAAKCLNEATIKTNAVSSSSTPAITATTFAIQEKRRFCNHIKREALITAVGNVVGTATTNSNEWTVNLSNPDYTVWIDICKTIAGISIIPDIRTYPRNFNLVEHRISLGGQDAEGKIVK